MISPVVDARWSEAQAFLADLGSRIRVRAAVLDHWGGTDRIVYDAPCMDACPSDCGQCPLHQAISACAPRDPARLITALVPASSGELDLLPAKQRRFNCKPYDQYLECLVAWIVAGCTTHGQIEEALTLLKDSRLLCMEGVTDLAAFEHMSKRIVVRECIVRSGRTGGRTADRAHDRAHDRAEDRAAIIAGAARHLGLLV
jgi:hypothetical protein